jgi:hypothetical protein
MAKGKECVLVPRDWPAFGIFHWMDVWTVLGLSCLLTKVGMITWTLGLLLWGVNETTFLNNLYNLTQGLAHRWCLNNVASCNGHPIDYCCSQQYLRSSRQTHVTHTLSLGLLRGLWEMVGDSALSVSCYNFCVWKFVKNSFWWIPNACTMKNN